MDPQLIRSADKLLGHHEILGVIIWREEELHFQHTAPCFSEAQIQSLGAQIHALFSGYRSTDRSIPGLSVQFEDRCMHIHVLNDEDTQMYVVSIAQSVEALSIAVEEISRWTLNAIMGRSNLSPANTRSPVRHSWGHFLLRIKGRLEKSMGLENGTELLEEALQTFGAGPTQPLPDDQWLAFSHHITNQIKDPAALMNFNQLYLEADETEKLQ